MIMKEKVWMYFYWLLFVKKQLQFFNLKTTVYLVKEKTSYSEDNAQWESARPNLDLPKIEARSEVSA